MAKRQLKLWGISNQDSGVQYYRINQPLRFIGKQKLAKVHTLPFYGQHNQHLTSHQYNEYYQLEGKWADVLVSTLATNREYLALLLALKELYGLKLVIDVDDDVLSTHTEPNNPAYQAYMMESARYAEYAQACMREADLLVVSTEYLKAKYASINPNIVVVKNAIDLDFFEAGKEPDDITIGYAGSGSHQGDWMMVEPVLKKLKEKHGVKIKVLGPMVTQIADEQIKWVDMLKYPETLASMGFSIGIAPLKDSLMARAKSNLRWLEYSALKVPTVSSDVVPFRGDTHNILVKEPEEWESELEKLVTDKKLRTSLGQAAYDEVKNGYNPEYWSRELYNAIERLYSR